MGLPSEIFHQGEVGNRVRIASFSGCAQQHSVLPEQALRPPRGGMQGHIVVVSDALYEPMNETSARSPLLRVKTKHFIEQNKVFKIVNVLRSEDQAFCNSLTARYKLIMRIDGTVVTFTPCESALHAEQQACPGAAPT